MPLLPRQPNILFEDIKFSEDAQYYIATKLNKSGRLALAFKEGFDNWLASKEAVHKSYTSYKKYAGKPQVRLKPYLKKYQKINWEKVILARKSSRNFLPEEISLQQLSNIFVLSCGMKENQKWLKKAKASDHWPRRSLPSAGALYPLEFYVLSFNVKGLKKGLYHYNVHEGAFSLLRDDKPSFDTEKYWAQRDLFKTPSALIFVSGVFERTRVKYGSRGLRFVLQEVGGVGAQMNLIATAEKLDFCFDGGGFEGQIEDLVGLDGYNEGILATFVLGHSLDSKP